MELDEITDIERLYTHGKEEPTLGRPYAALLERWEDGQDDRETCLRLLFLTWYSCCEPWYLTGLPEDPPPAGRFASIFDRLGGEQTDDPEILAAVGLMATSFPYCCGDEKQWLATGLRLRERYRQLPPASQFDPAHFEGRGAYGWYMARMAPSLLEEWKTA